MLSKNRSLRLFRLFGVNVYVHYSWAIVAGIQIYLARNNVGLFTENPHGVPYHILVYLCLFLIVLTHEFGHALACKSVGGKAEEIFLWPLGGIAYVQPPPRAGAMLWSIAAGPLVNVVLLPITLVPAYLMHKGIIQAGVAGDLLYDVAAINAVLLFFNLLPFYPLDGGQIVRSLLWFACGRGMSLVIAAAIGLAGAAVLGAWALYMTDVWLAVLIGFLGMTSFKGLQQGMALRRLEKVPRHDEAHCPKCRERPMKAPVWACPCGARFDTFDHRGKCPGCGREFPTTACLFCGETAPMTAWYGASGPSAAAGAAANS